MNITELLNILMETLNGIDMVNTITLNRSDQIDLQKTNIYPLINIFPSSYTTNDMVNIYNINIKMLQQRNTLNKLNHNEKTFGSNNLPDNWNDVSQIANVFISRTRNNPELTLLNDPDITLLYNVGTNNLDGVEFELNIQTINNISC